MWCYCGGGSNLIWFFPVGLFRGRLYGEILGLCRSSLRPTCSCPPEAAAKVMTAMLVGSLGNRHRPVWRDVFGCV